MNWRLAAAGRIAKHRLPTPRRCAALLGVFAVLLQAMLFAWHSHPLAFTSRAAPAVLTAQGAGHQTPLGADQDCQICFALAHHGAVPIDCVAAAPLDRPAAPPPLTEAVNAPPASYLLFRSRAPPQT